MSHEIGTPVEADPRYPIGRFVRPETLVPGERENAIATLAEAPNLLRNAVQGLHREQIETPYREGGWTVRQVIHHVADSHVNAVVRVKKALTEDWPTISVYDEAAWADLHDMQAPIEWSLQLVEATHARWVMLLSSLTEGQWQRGFVHPERGRSTVENATLLYAWHSKHHTAHIMHLRARMDW